MSSIYVYGASGHGLVIADLAKACGYSEIIFIDDGNNNFLAFKDIKVNNKIPFVLGIGSNKVRKKIFDKLISLDFKIITLIHPSAVVSDSSTIGEGSTIMPNVVVNANSKIGKAVILNSSSVIEHENYIDDFVHISPNSALAGNVTIGKFTQIGIGTSIIQGIIVQSNCIIGAGSVVVKNIDKNKLAFGNPCKIIKELN